ncbi:MAG: endonuclease/exonuclease/phosphatase family protein [Cyclobacteriaceae bacterium]|nr:endonuclease/exonuclease/phosphatase family protein [Cyclobacteriaceae bacterium]
MKKKVVHFFIIILLLSSCNKKQDTLRVMTYNIRYDTSNDGINQWKNRKEKVVDLIKDHDPDIFGIQEGLFHQVAYLDSMLVDYTYCGTGRDDGKTGGEYSALFYKSSVWEILDCNTSWLSPNPESAEKPWDAAFPRIITMINALHQNTRDTFFIINTHFDHIGDTARKESAKIIRNLIEKNHTKKILVLGDFNCTPESEPYKILTSNAHLLFDSYATAKHIQGPGGTFASEFHVDNLGNERIDHIFTNLENIKKYKIIDQQEKGHFPSDHLPVLIEVAIK